MTDKIHSYKHKEENRRSFPEYVDLSSSKLTGSKDYTITVEISGDNVFVHVDDEHFLLVKSARIRTSGLSTAPASDDRSRRRNQENIPFLQEPESQHKAKQKEALKANVDYA